MSWIQTSTETGLPVWVNEAGEVSYTQPQEAAAPQNWTPGADNRAATYQDAVNQITNGPINGQGIFWDGSANGSYMGVGGAAPTTGNYYWGKAAPRHKDDGTIMGDLLKAGLFVGGSALGMNAAFGGLGGVGDLGLAGGGEVGSGYASSAPGSAIGDAVASAGGGFQMPAAVAESPASLATQGLTQTAPGVWNGEATPADYASLAGILGSTALGAYSSNQQTQAFQRLADQYASYGAPYRQKLSDLYANPTSFLSSQEVQVPVQQATDALARSLSIHGNPAGNGSALQEIQNYSANQLFGRLGQEKDRLAGYGGITQYNAAAPQAASNAVQSSGNTANAIGAGMSSLLNPPPTLAQTMADFRRMSQGLV